MSTVTSPVPTSKTSAPAVKVCRHAGCRQQLGSKNTCGFCREHRSHTKNISSDGHGLKLATRQPVAERAAPLPAKPNGADQHDRDGNRAQPAEGPARVESRVDMLLAAIPSADKAKMLCAWLAGTL